MREKRVSEIEDREKCKELRERERERERESFGDWRDWEKRRVREKVKERTDFFNKIIIFFLHPSQLLVLYIRPNCSQVAK